MHDAIKNSLLEGNVLVTQSGSLFVRLLVTDTMILKLLVLLV